MLKSTMMFGLLLTALVGQCQTPANVTVMTGRSWYSLSPMSKQLFVQGLEEGQMIAMIYLDSDERARVWEIIHAKGFTPNDYIKELDTLYQDRESLNIPVMLGYNYINWKLKGTSTREELGPRPFKCFRLKH